MFQIVKKCKIYFFLNLHVHSLPLIVPLIPPTVFMNEKICLREYNKWYISLCLFTVKVMTKPVNSWLAYQQHNLSSFNKFMCFMMEKVSNWLLLILFLIKFWLVHVEFETFLFYLSVHVLPNLSVHELFVEGHGGPDHMVVGFTTTYAISAYHH